MTRWLGSWSGVFIAATLTTIAATAVAQTIAYFVYPDHAVGVAMQLTPIIATITAFPFCVFIWAQVRKNIELSIELQRLVNRDRLTDVGTRDYFFKTMEAEPVASGISLMVDIDHFKRVNDQHGHFFGDEVIRRAAQVLRESTRDKDMLCRFGGEGFLIFLSGRSEAEGLEVAERMRKKIAEQAIEYRGEMLSVTVSIGAAQKKVTEDIEQSIQRADAALYHAKESGRNMVVMSAGRVRAA
ncbi:GGDEF domain-containing protein [Yoonia sediminilitoris]|nr:GGDEF domain-containing protein [Yoonia sediminilitoris]